MLCMNSHGRCCTGIRHSQQELSISFAIFYGDYTKQSNQKNLNNCALLKSSLKSDSLNSCHKSACRNLNHVILIHPQLPLILHHLTFRVIIISFFLLSGLSYKNKKYDVVLFIIR